MDFGISVATHALAVILGAVCWHFLHTKAHIAIARLEGKVSAVEARAKTDVSAVEAKVPDVPKP